MDIESVRGLFQQSCEGGQAGGGTKSVGQAAPAECRPIEGAGRDNSGASEPAKKGERRLESSLERLVRLRSEVERFQQSVAGLADNMDAGQTAGRLGVASVDQADPSMRAVMLSLGHHPNPLVMQHSSLLSAPHTAGLSSSEPSSLSLSKDQADRCGV